MSPNVGNFVHDLVEMAKAMETLPQVQQQLDSAEGMVKLLEQTVQDRELSILSLKSDIEALNSRIHEAEVAKDAAETMFLEADDRTQRALAFVKTTFGNAGALIQALEPPKPTDAGVQVQAVPEAAPVAEDTAKDVASPPMHEAQLEATQATGWVEGNVMQSQGQSESPLPVDTVASSQTAGTTTEPIAAPSTLTKPQPFVGLRYYDHPTYVSLSDWLAGGGTDDDYNWQPGYERAPIF